MTILKLALAALLTITPAFASAQTDNSTMTIVNVPFAFEVGPTHLAPGRYTIKRETGHMIRVTGVAGTGTLMILAEESPSSASSTKVVFKHFGDQYFLSQLYVAGRTGHIEAIATREQRQAQKMVLAGNKIQPLTPAAPAAQTVIVAALR
jgi:hypothetical protein